MTRVAFTLFAALCHFAELGLLLVLLVVSAPLALLGRSLMFSGERIYRFSVWLIEKPKEIDISAGDPT